MHTRVAYTYIIIMDTSYFFNSILQSLHKSIAINHFEPETQIKVPYLL